MGMSMETMQVNDASANYLATAEAQGVPPGYKRTEVGVIPEDWEHFRLGDAVDLLTGFPFPSSGYVSSGILLVRGSNVKRGQLDWNSDITKYWPSITPDISRYELRESDLVIAMDGALVGRSYAVITYADLPSLLLQRVARIRSSKVHQSLLACWIGSDSFVSYVDSVKTHTAIPHISPADIRSFVITIPHNPVEQRAIAETLSDVDGLLGALEALIAKKQAIKLATMQQLLTGKTRLPGFSGVWGTKRLEELGHFLKGSGVTRDNAQSGPLACVRYGEIYTSHHDHIRAFYSWISTEVAASATRLQRGDLLFAGSGETKEEIGKCVAFVGGEEAYAGGDIVILRPVGVVDSLFLGYALNTSDVYRQKASLGQGDAVVHISARALAQVNLPLPQPDEQAAIATVLSDMDSEITALEQRRDKTRALKQGMMQQLLTGRVRLVEGSPVGKTGVC